MLYTKKYTGYTIRGTSASFTMGPDDWPWRSSAFSASLERTRRRKRVTALDITEEPNRPTDQPTDRPGSTNAHKLTTNIFKHPSARVPGDSYTLPGMYVCNVCMHVCPFTSSYELAETCVFNKHVKKKSIKKRYKIKHLYIMYVY